MTGDLEAKWWPASLLGLLSPGAREALVGLGARKALAPGMKLITQGDPPDGGLAVILSGRVKIVGRDVLGRTRVLAFRGAGDVVGEIGVLDGKPRTADVVTAGPVEVVLVDAGRFEDFLRRYPDAQRAVTDTVVAKLRLATSRRIDFDHSPAIVKVAVSLLQQADFEGVQRGDAVIVRLTQPELAELAGASLASVQQAVAKLKAPSRDPALRRLDLGTAPTVRVTHGRIIILRRDALEVIAQIGLLIGGGFYLARWLRSPSKVGLSFVVRILVGVALVFFVVLPLVSTIGIAAFALLYDQVVRQRHHGCDPAEFTPVEISVKETSTRAWVHTRPA